MAKAKKGSNSSGKFAKKVTRKFQGTAGANVKQKKEQILAIVERHINKPMMVLFSAIERGAMGPRKKKI